MPCAWTKVIRRHKTGQQACLFSSRERDYKTLLQTSTRPQSSFDIFHQHGTMNNSRESARQQQKEDKPRSTKEAKIKNERKVQEKNKSNNTKLTTEAKTPCGKQQEKSLTKARRRAFSRQSEPLAVCFRTAVHHSLNQVQQFDNRWKATAMIYLPPQESSHSEVHTRYCSTRKPLAMAMA